jgi:hypothetical protein
MEKRWRATALAPRRWRDDDDERTARSVLECASPLALWAEVRWPAVVRSQLSTAQDGEDADGSLETAGIVSTASLVRLKFVAIKITEPVFDLKQKVFL